MNPKHLQVTLSALRVLETIYLAVSLVIVFSRKVPSDIFQVFLENWVFASYFVLPLLLFKNVVVAVFNKGILSERQKTWLLIRCALYALLSLVAYPLIFAL